MNKPNTTQFNQRPSKKHRILANKYRVLKCYAWLLWHVHCILLSGLN